MEYMMINIEDSINFYIDELLIRGYAETTIEIYSDIMNKFKDYLDLEFKNIEYVNSVTLQQISLFRIYMKNKLDATQTVIDRAVSCIRTFFTLLFRLNIIKENPVKELKHHRKPENTLPHCLNEVEIEELSKSLERHNVEEKIVFLLISETGSKRSTLLNLKWKDVDFKNGTIALDSETTKARTTKMTQKLYSELSKYQDISNTSEYILCSNKCNKMSTSKFNKTFKSVVNGMEEEKFKKIRISKLDSNEKLIEISRTKITPTVLRNTFIKFLVDHGLDIALIKNAVGLKDYKSVKQYSSIKKGQN